MANGEKATVDQETAVGQEPSDRQRESRYRDYLGDLSLSLSYPRIESISRRVEVLGVLFFVGTMTLFISLFLYTGLFGIVSTTVILARMAGGLFGAGVCCFIASMLLDGSVEWLRSRR